MSYMFPEYNSVKDYELAWHGAKLAEECGEVCQGICKGNNYEDIANECFDVIQCAENILRKIGITHGMYDCIAVGHVDKDTERGYIRMGEI